MSFQDLEAGLPLRQQLRQQQQQQRQEGQQDPSQAVEKGIFQINTSLFSYNRLIKSLGTPKDSPELRAKLRTTKQRINELVNDTKTKLKQACETDHFAEVSPTKKINDAKLAREFMSSLNEFDKAKRLAADKESTYSPFFREQVLPSSFGASELDSSACTSPEERNFLLQSKTQDVVILDNEIAFNEALIEEREQDIKETQQQIHEVSEIMKDLATLVHAQRPMLDVLDRNIEHAHSKTAQATSELVKASKIQRSNSSTSCLLLVIFGLILIIVTIVVVA